MDKKRTPTRGTVKLTRLHTAQAEDKPTLGVVESTRVVSLLLTVIDAIESTAHEQSTNDSMHQRRLTLKETRIIASTLKRVGALIDKIILDRVRELPTKKGL
jgi:hypothetical protein